MAKIARAKSDEHNVIVHCKQYPEMKFTGGAAADNAIAS